MELLRLWQRDRKTVVLVTHSISEAVLLSDRVLVMSERPGTIIEDVRIDLPRPARPQRHARRSGLRRLRRSAQQIDGSSVMESGSVKTAGAEIYYQTHGAGPAVVLAHGIGGNHAIWYGQIDALARSNRVILFDHRGFGLSRDLDGRGARRLCRGSGRPAGSSGRGPGGAGRSVDGGGDLHRFRPSDARKGRGPGHLRQPAHGVVESPAVKAIMGRGSHEDRRHGSDRPACWAPRRRATWPCSIARSPASTPWTDTT